MMAPPNYTQFNIFFLVCRSCDMKLYTMRGYILTLHFIHLFLIWIHCSCVMDGPNTTSQLIKKCLETTCSSPSQTPRRSRLMYVARALDREAIDEYRLEIAVTDGVFISRCRVNIEILDDNDSPPYCEKYLYRENVAENILPGSPILTVTATDADEGQNARQIFSLGGSTKELFSIDPQSGVLTNVLMLDRETQDRHFLTVNVQVND